MSLICKELQEVLDRAIAGKPKEYDLVINVPFGTSKSSLCVLAQAWTWTKAPWFRHICASHTDSLVTDLADRCRSVLQSDKYREVFPGVDIRQDRNARDDFANTEGGERKSCTVGGKTPTGRHCHCLWVDDALDPQGARSEAELDTAGKFMTEVIPSRVVDKEASPTILIMQRLEIRDPTGVMLGVSKKEGAVPVRLICLPGELTDDVQPPLEDIRKLFPEAYGEDGLLDPRRLSRRVLNHFRATLGDYSYGCQVLQKPKQPGGSIFKAYGFTRRDRSAPYDAKRIRYYDRAATANGGCATAGVLMARGKDGQFYVEHCLHGRWEPNERNDRIVAQAYLDRDRYGPHHTPLIVVEAERGSTGLESFQGLARRLAGFRIVEDQPTGSKDVRAEPWADMIASGNVVVIEANWDIAGYVDEHLAFRPMPGKRIGGYCDRVDASAAAFAILSGRKTLGGLRTITLGARPKTARALVLTFDDLAQLHMDQRCLLVYIQEPLPAGEGVMPDGPMQTLRGESPERGLPGKSNVTQPVGGHGAQGDPATASHSGSETLPDRPPVNALERLLDSHRMVFVDLDPADYQDRWTEPVEGHGKPPAELMLSREQAKGLWRFLLRRRDPGPELYVFAGETAPALSVCYAVCDGVGLQRRLIWQPGDAESKHVTPPSRHVYEQVKAMRGTVYG